MADNNDSFHQYLDNYGSGLRGAQEQSQRNLERSVNLGMAISAGVRGWQAWRLTRDPQQTVRAAAVGAISYVLIVFGVICTFGFGLVTILAASSTTTYMADGDVLTPDSRGWLWVTVPGLFLSVAMVIGGIVVTMRQTRTMRALAHRQQVPPAPRYPGAIDTSAH
jgi:uncharacterized membrane protein YedE/YeeE